MQIVITIRKQTFIENNLIIWDNYHNKRKKFCQYYIQFVFVEKFHIWQKQQIWKAPEKLFKLIRSHNYLFHFKTSEISRTSLDQTLFLFLFPFQAYFVNMQNSLIWYSHKSNFFIKYQEHYKPTPRKYLKERLSPQPWKQKYQD